jgi:hypothetical protein
MSTTPTQNADGSWSLPSETAASPASPTATTPVVPTNLAPAANAEPAYYSAAQDTAASNQAAINAQTLSNRVDQTNAQGASTWSQNPDGSWVQNTTLTAPLQAATTAQQNTQAGLSSAAQNQLSQVSAALAGGAPVANPNSYESSVPANQQFNANSVTNGINANYQAQVGLLQPQMTQDTTNLDASLRAQGLTPGSNAYNNAMQNLQRTQAQTLTQASNNASLTGNQEAVADYGAQEAGQGQSYAQAMNNYNTNNGAALQNYLLPLQTEATLQGMAGTVATPQFANYVTANTAGGTDYGDAANAAGNYASGALAAQTAQNNSNTQAGGALAGAALNAAATYFKSPS